MEFGRTLAGTARRAVAALLVLLIACHALAPVTAPLERVSGSAFSSATFDVSVMRARTTESVRRLAGIAPAPAVRSEAPPARPRLAGARPQPDAWPQALAPPAAPGIAPLVARGPPAA